MAKLNRGIFGPISGKLGNLVGGVWKGIPFIKVYKPSLTKRERTPAQIANEEKFKFVNNWLVPFHPFLSTGYLNESKHRTTIAACLSQVYNTVFTGVFPNLEIHYDKMMISVGKLSGVADPQIVFISANTIELTWKKNTGKGTSYNDQIILVLYDREGHEADGMIGGINRTKEKCTFQFKHDLIGKSLDVYIGLYSLDRSKISNSQYLGRIIPV